MNKRPSTTDEASELRRQAEAKLDRQKQSGQPVAAAEMQSLIHELQVHQIELEMQNDELRRTRTELEASQTRYFDIFDLAPVGYLILSEKNMIVEANLTVASLLGLARSLLTNYSFPLFIQRADRIVYHQHWKKLIETSDPQACELCMKRRDGSPFWARLEMSAGLDADGARAQRVILSDISERKQAETALRESEARFRDVLENSLDASYKHNIKTNAYDYMSPVFGQLTGYNPQEMENLSIETVLGLMHPDDQAEFDRVIAESMAGPSGARFHVEYRFKHRDSRYRWLDDRFTFLRDADGQPQARIGSVGDITVRKQAEESLRESEVRFSTVFHASPLAIAITRLRDNQYIDVNEAWQRVTGLSRAEVLGRTPMDFSSWVNPDERVRFIETLREHGSVTGFELEMRKESGIIANMLLSADIVEINGDRCILSMALDVTERKQAEIALRESRDLLVNAFNKSPLMKTLSDLSTGKYLEVNDSFCRASEFSREEVIGKTAIELGWISKDARIQMIQKVLQDGSVNGIELSLRSKNGKIIIGRYWGTVIHTAQGDKLFSAAEDITERRRMDELIKESEAQLAMAQQVGNTGSWGYNIETDTIWGSDEALHIYGLRPGVTAGFPVEKIEACIPEKDRVHQALIDLINEEREYDLEFVINPADGTPAKVISSIARLEKNAKGKPHKVIGFLQDITVRKQAEELLRESEENYRRSEFNLKEAQSVAHVGSWHWDLKTNEVTWSDEMYRIFGIDKFSHSGRLGAVIGKVIHPEDLHIVLPSNAQAISEQKPIEYRIILPDGSIRNIWAKAGDTIFDQEGKPIKMTGVAQDITERKRAEDALREAHWRMESIIEATQVGTWEWNVQTGETVFNEKWAQIIGYTLAELAPVSIQTWEKFAHPDDLKQSNALLEKHITGELTNYEYETRMKHKDDTWVWVLDRGRIITHTSDGKPLMMFGTLQDITARKQAENELRASEQRYRDMFDKNTAVKLLIDPGSGAIIEANQAAAKFYGWSTALLKAMNINQINTLSTEEIKIEMEHADRQSRSYFIFRHRLASGDIRDVEIYSSPIDISGHKLLFSIIHDITERKQAEQALQEAHDLMEQRVQERTAELSAANLVLDKAARMKDEFLAAMSHELRTPLTGILGLSEIMQMPGHDPLTEKQSTSLTHIHTSGQRLLEIINDMLDFSLIGSGKFDLNLAPCSLEEICQASLRKMLVQAEAKHLQHNFSMSHSHIMVSADVRRLQKVLFNLLDNAVKFTPQGGSFGIEAWGDSSKKQVYITVWDTGIGIKEEDLPRLFQPFIQLDASLARQYNGTGLRLALVRKLTELHGGSVSVESTFGSGSRFTVCLPWQGLHASPK